MLAPQRWSIAALVVGLAPICGCHAPPVPCSPQCISNGLERRTGYQLCAANCPGEVYLPPGTALDDGLTEDEAIAIALCNNAAFQDLLVDLRLANADLLQAGLLPNPEVGYFFPVSDKPFKYVLDFPLESLWLRPLREDAAAGEVARVRDRLVQSALDVIRDVRVIYNDVLLAEARQNVGRRAVELRGRIASMADARLQAGDVSPQEVATARIDSLQAVQDATRLRYDVELALERLRHVMGISDIRTPLRLDPSRALPLGPLEADALVAEAVSSRPDAIAAQQAVSAAQERLRLARVGWIRFLGIADATSGRDTGHELSPAFRATLPIFNWNQGAVARAEAELERAVRQQQVLHDVAVLDVRRAHLQYDQARAELDHLRNKVRPEVDAAIRGSQTAYREGETTYLFVLEATRQLLDSYLREAVLETDLRRATAELERSVGRRLSHFGPAPQPLEWVDPGLPAPPTELPPP